MLGNRWATYFDEWFQYECFMTIDQVHFFEVGLAEKKNRYFLLGFLFYFVSIRSNFTEGNVMFRFELEIHPFHKLLPNKVFNFGFKLPNGFDKICNSDRLFGHSIL